MLLEGIVGEVLWNQTIVPGYELPERLHLSPHRSRRVQHPAPDAVALQRRSADGRVSHRPVPGGRVVARRRHAGARRPRSRCRGDDLRRLAELRRRLQRARRSGAGAVQGGVHRHPLHVPGRDLQPLRLHLGGQGLCAGTRSLPGLSEEAGQHLDDAAGHHRQGRSPRGPRRSIRRNGRLPRSPHRQCPSHAARGKRRQRVRQRSPDDPLSLHARHRGRRARQLLRAGHDERPRRRARPGVER
jgi:hypothetical protein